MRVISGTVMHAGFFSRKTILFISFILIAFPAFNQSLVPERSDKTNGLEPASSIKIQDPALVINPDQPLILKQQAPNLDVNLNNNPIFSDQVKQLNRNVKRKSVLLPLHSKPWKKRKPAVSGQVLTGAIVAAAGIVLLIVGGTPIYLIGSLLLVAGVVMILLDLVT